MVLAGTVFPTGLGLGATWNENLIWEIANVINTEAAAVGVHTIYRPIEFRNIQLKPFEVCIRAGARSMMRVNDIDNGMVVDHHKLSAPVASPTKSQS